MNPALTFKDRESRTGCIPISPKAGIVWTYLGADPAPLLPDWAGFHIPGFTVVAFQHVPCNSGPDHGGLSRPGVSTSSGFSRSLVLSSERAQRSHGSSSAPGISRRLRVRCRLPAQARWVPTVAGRSHRGVPEHRRRGRSGLVPDVGCSDRQRQHAPRVPTHVHELQVATGRVLNPPSRSSTKAVSRPTETTRRFRLHIHPTTWPPISSVRTSSVSRDLARSSIGLASA